MTHFDSQISMRPQLRGSTKQFCVVVDAYSSGNLLAPELKSRGFECIHVRSGPATTWTGFKACDFSENIIFSGDIQLLLSNLRGSAAEKRDIVCVLPGAECGVALADLLSSALGLPSNGTKYSVARRNKFEMQVALERHGIRSIPQIRSSSLEEILDWMRARDAERFVLKPMDSAGTDEVNLCSSEEDVRRAFERVYGKENQLELLNSSVLAQEFVEGIEYAVDTVSRCGRHFVTDIWHYGKRWLDGAPVYDFGALIPSASPEAIVLCEHVKKVLDALGIAYGPAHSEIMLTPHGPALIESGARPAGRKVPLFAKHCVGLSQIELTVDAYLDFESFDAKTKSPYPLLRNGLWVDLICHQPGVVQSLAGLEAIKQLESFYTLHVHVQKGAHLEKTRDLDSSPGLSSLAIQNKRYFGKTISASAIGRAKTASSK